jgi:hypothetical protein
VSGLARILCAGAPRDLGLDQGRVARAAIRGAAPTALARRVARDLERFFPHHAERLQGLALGAGVAELGLFAPLADLLAGEGGLAVAAHGASGPLLARSLPTAPAALVLRESAPDNDYRSLELAPAASVTAFIGVNEHGLAATATALPAPDSSLDGCAAPAQLLVQDVLQRFDSAEKAADWALRRPAGGHASLLLADAGGNVRAVEVEGRTRRPLGAGEPALVGVGHAPARAGLEKALAESRAVDAESLARLLADAAQSTVVAVADPSGRRLGLARAGAPLAWHPLAGRS